MDDDWASGGEDEAGLGDISAIPQVKILEQVTKPVQLSQKSAPPVNAWATKPSGDVRNVLRRHQSEPRQTHIPMQRHQRRENLPASFTGYSERTERSNSRSGSSSGYSRPTTLYVTNLPYDASEDSISSFFQSQGVLVTNVRIVRHIDTGNIKAAFVRIPSEQNKQQALSVHGRIFGSRNIHVKVDNAEGSRRRDRGGSVGNISYGGNFNPRERRENSSNGWGSSPRADRASASAEGLDRRAGGDLKEDKRRDASQIPDPTIPTGPPPVGRKKLQLKPRTKPMPALDVDRRAIDAPRAPISAPPVLARDRNRPLSGGGDGPGQVPGFRSEEADNAGKSYNAEGFKRSGTHRANNEKNAWTSPKDSGAARQTNSSPSLSRKEDDSKRPVLLNAFAALEVNDSDVYEV